MPDQLRNAKTSDNAAQQMTLRTWPRDKAAHTVATAGTPVEVDLSVHRGRTCFFRATGGMISGRVFSSPATAPTVVVGEDMSIARNQSEEFYVWGDANLRLVIDSDTDGAKLVIMSDDTL